MIEPELLEQIAAEVGTPVYVYSGDAIRDAWRQYDRAFSEVPHEICYAVKANANLAILALLAKEGSGFDIVSAGELYRVLQAGGRPERAVFSGAGKTAAELEFAIAHGVRQFNCESEAELALLNGAAAGAPVQFAMRVNPDVNAATHPYISTGLKQHKFGIDIAEALAVYHRSRCYENLIASGVSCHIGSQILDLDPLEEAAHKVLDLAAALQAEGFPIRHVDLGGGLGIVYQPGDRAPAIEQLAGRIAARVRHSGLSLTLEPGRSLVGAAGVLLTRVLYRKQNGTRHFVIVDAGMNDLIRPALYQAHHEIRPVRDSGLPDIVADVVGPVCETGDFLARNRTLTGVETGALLVVETAGAYGFSQASNYNSRPRPAEVLVEGGAWRVIRTRETFADLVRGENI